MAQQDERRDLAFLSRRWRAPAQQGSHEGGDLAVLPPRRAPPPQNLSQHIWSAQPRRWRFVIEIVLLQLVGHYKQS